MRERLDPARGLVQAGQRAEFAANLAELYDYICRRLLLATTENKVEMLDEVSGLMHEIRSAWLAIAPEARSR